MHGAGEPATKPAKGDEVLERVSKFNGAFTVATDESVTRSCGLMRIGFSHVTACLSPVSCPFVLTGMLKNAQDEIEQREAAAQKEEEKKKRRETMAFGGQRHGTKCVLPPPQHIQIPTFCLLALDLSLRQSL